ncbi:hypothetical protein [Bifidobacterium castoris]|uniref:hypothetical protein n=1 Tax=Bifidobacterium castoris TaxID=2306972 RepID=UPI000F7D5BFA|nr:hypothetical protein [Bifidobacterium castoris]
MLQAVDTFAQQRAELIQTYVRQVWNVWKSLTPADWWNDAVTLGAASQAARFEMAFLETVGRLGVSYADAMLGMAGVSSDGAYDVSYVAPRQGTTPLRVMERVADTYRGLAVQSPSLRPDSWDALEGADLSTVTGWLRASLDRLEDIANTDAQMTAHRLALGRFSSKGVTQYRRVIHPELSKTGTCGLCAVASTRVYSTRSLMPLHSNCKCGVAPITTVNDVGKDITEKDLERYYELAGSTSAADLKNIRLQVQTNGELGPVLAADARKDGRTVSNWTPPDRKTTREQAKRIISNYRAYEDMYRELLDDGAESVKRTVDGRTRVFKRTRKATMVQSRNFYRTYIEVLRNEWPDL